MAQKTLFLLLTFSLFATSDSLAQDSLSKDSFVQAGNYYSEKADLVFDKNLDSFYYYQVEAAANFKKAEAWENYIDCLSNISYYHFVQTDFNNFEQQAISAVEEAEKYLSEDNEAYNISLNNLAVFLRIKNDYDRAISTYKKVIQTQTKHHQEDLTGLATSYHNLATVYRNMGDHQEAIHFLNKAADLQMEALGKTNYPIAKTYLTLGNNYRDQGNMEKALIFYNQFLDIANTLKTKKSKKEFRDLIYCYQSMAKSFLKQGQTDSTLYFIQKAKTINASVNQLDQAFTFEILGDYYLETNKSEEAIKAFQKANQLNLLGLQKFNQHSTKARSFRKTGNAYLANGDIELALQAFQKGLNYITFNVDRTLLFANPSAEDLLSKKEAIEIVKGKAKAFTLLYEENKSKEDLQTALNNYAYATRLIQDLRQSFLAQGSKELLAQKALPIYEGGIKTALALYAINQKEQFLHQAFAFAEQNKAMLLLESLQDIDAKFNSAIPKEELEKEKQLRINIAFYEKQINAKKQKKEKTGGDKITEWQSKLFDLRQDYQNLIAHFEKAYPKYYDLKYNTQLADANALRKKIITPQTALLEYFIGEEKSYLFCITSKDLKIIPLDLPNNFGEDINSLRQLITQAPAPESFLAECQGFSAASWQLSQQLVRPILHFLPEEIEQLIIVPDDLLAYLPFELLLEKAPPAAVTDFYDNTFSYLQNRYAISYNYSASLLLNHSKNKNAHSNKGFIGFAPSFGNNRSEKSRACDSDQLLSLNCNQQEVNNINDLFNGRTLLATQADRQTFLDEASNYRIVHLATHACAGEDYLAQNRIHFTDDFLSNKDLHNLNLQADLAVLSACNTGSGKLVKGEGVMSLSRGFILAGCPSTLMSLWSVDDCTTSDLMFAFYKNIKDGLPKDKALQQAKIQHLKTADKATAHPYYWAAFVQSGNAEAMDFNSGLLGGNWRWILLGLGLFLFFLKKRAQSIA